jgi:serine/threonine protein kinase
MLPLVCPLCRIAIPPVDDVCPRDGHPGREVDWVAVPPTLSQRFSVIEPFASGESGSLYIADEPETGRRGLLKVLAQPGVLAQSGVETRGGSAREPKKDQLAERQRLRRELVKQATLTRTHLLVPLASGESEGFTWLFREWLDGVSLDVRLSREGALQQTEALAIAAQIASALDELHRGGLLHRDVKPGHIFLQPTPQGIPRALLLDAGVASAVPADVDPTIYGTAGYVAPEQLLGKLVSFRSDLYSLGCVLYRMLTGRPAFAGETLAQTLSAQRQGELPPTPADLPNGIGTLLQSILAKDPQQRPFSAQKLRRTLDPFLPDGALMEKQPTTTFETVPQPSPSVAPQPSGTLKPPAHPSARLSMPAPPLSPAAALRPRTSSAPPPAPPSAHRVIRDENTQQIDIAQLQEIAQPKRTASLPPPTPAARSSLPPPVPGSAKPSSLPPPPQPPSDKTQPIRLDQILAVAAARKSVNAPPSAPKPIEEEATGVFHPRLVAGAPPVQDDGEREDGEQQAPVPPPALFSARDEPFVSSPSTTFLSRPEATRPAGAAGPRPEERRAAAPAAHVDDVRETAPRPALFQPALPPPPAIAKPVVAHVPSVTARSFPAPPPQAPASFAPTLPAAGVPPVTAAALPDASSAEGFAKATLMGIGVDPLAPAEPLLDGSLELPTMELRDERSGEPPRGHEREHPTERVPLAGSSFEPPSLDDAFGARAAGSIPSGTLGSAGGQQSDTRRLLMYASAAVVGLAVLAVGASALRGKPEPVAAPAYANVPPLPASAAAAAPTAPAQAQRPTVQSLKPSTTSLAPAAPTTTALAAAPGDSDKLAAAPAAGDKLAPVTTPVPVVEPARAVPMLAPEEPERREASASSHRTSESSGSKARASGRAEREAARSAKSSSSSKASSEKSTDKAALFAAARDEARTAYAAKRYKEAAAAYERASKYDPKHAGTFAGLGAARLQQGDNKAAVQAYQRAVALSPETSGFHAALGRALLANGDKAKATAAYKKALALDPRNEAAKVALKQL